MNKAFKCFAPVTKHWKSTTPEGVEQRFMEVTLSGVKEDRDGERVSEKAVDGMINQLKSGSVPFYLNHGLDKNGDRTYRIEDMTGVWVDGRMEGTNLKATVRLNSANESSEVIWKYAEQGMPIGFSIGGRILSKEVEEVDIE